ncbi:uncharacterized protein BDW70DRAFT_169997 [Aspergillus foveolatus]|uniref:uncharacterized protein n=1 Tax=Aspergillus foveolatus TaxID=210207 RepID=UPI003CCCAFD8
MAESTAAVAPSTLKKKHASVSLNQENMNADQMEGVKEEPHLSTTITTQSAISTSTKPSKTGETETKDPRSNGFDENSDTRMATIESLLAENDVLQTQLTQLKTALHDAQNHIFSLQPHIQTLPNADAITLFQSLVCSVENWVDKYLADSLEEKEVAADALNIDGIRNLMNLIPPEGKAAFNIANTDVDIIQAAILRFLVESIFNQEFSTPLPRPEMEFVMEVERAMRVLKPKRDINRLMSDIRTIRHWHIETYTAASARPGFDKYAHDRMWNLTVHMINMLRAFAPTTDPNTLAKSFLKTVTKPACDLARRFHLCFDEYSLEWSEYHDNENLVEDPAGALQRVINEGRFREYDFVRVGEERKWLRDIPTSLSSGNGGREGKDGDGNETKVTVRWLFDIAPKLVFRKLKVDSCGENKVLVKPRVLVRVSEQKRTGPTKKMVKKAERVEYKTVLGAVQGWLTRQEHLLEKERKDKERAGKQLGGLLGGIF